MTRRLLQTRGRYTILELHTCSTKQPRSCWTFACLHVNDERWEVNRDFSSLVFQVCFSVLQSREYRKSVMWSHTWHWMFHKMHYPHSANSCPLNCFHSIFYSSRLEADGLHGMLFASVGANHLSCTWAVPIVTVKVVPPHSSPHRTVWKTRPPVAHTQKWQTYHSTHPAPFPMYPTWLADILYLVWRRGLSVFRAWPKYSGPRPWILRKSFWLLATHRMIQWIHIAAIAIMRHLRGLVRNSPRWSSFRLEICFSFLVMFIERGCLLVEFKRLTTITWHSFAL